jgi:heme/copper-type cytochrome/quinol oxidase subunit 4
LLIIALIILIISLFFFLFGYISRQQDDEGNASVFTAIGLVLIVADFIFFMVIANLYNFWGE